MEAQGPSPPLDALNHMLLCMGASLPAKLLEHRNTVVQIPTLQQALDSFLENYAPLARALARQLHVDEHEPRLVRPWTKWFPLKKEQPTLEQQKRDLASQGVGDLAWYTLARMALVCCRLLTQWIAFEEETLKEYWPELYHPSLQEEPTFQEYKEHMFEPLHAKRSFVTEVQAFAADILCDFQ